MQPVFLLHKVFQVFSIAWIFVLFWQYVFLMISMSSVTLVIHRIGSCWIYLFVELTFANFMFQIVVFHLFTYLVSIFQRSFFVILFKMFSNHRLNLLVCLHWREEQTFYCNFGIYLYELCFLWFYWIFQHNLHIRDSLLHRIAQIVVLRWFYSYFNLSGTLEAYPDSLLDIADAKFHWLWRNLNFFSIFTYLRSSWYISGI